MRTYITAQWYLYDLCFNSVSRLETFRRLLALGIDKREAVYLIHSVSPKDPNQ
jgi:Fe2+ transport system protein FeoA